MPTKDQGPRRRRFGAGAPDPGRDAERARRTSKSSARPAIRSWRARSIKETQPGRADARRRDAAHGRPHVPREPDAPAADAGGDGVVADRARRRDHAQGARARRDRFRRPSRKVDVAGTLADFSDEILAQDPHRGRRARGRAQRRPARRRRARPSIPADAILPANDRAARMLRTTRPHHRRSARPPAAPKRSASCSSGCRPTARRS